MLEEPNRGKKTRGVAAAAAATAAAAAAGLRLLIVYLARHLDLQPRPQQPSRFDHQVFERVERREGEGREGLLTFWQAYEESVPP